MKKTCANCGHCAVVSYENDIPDNLECRRYAPRMLSGSGECWSDQLWPFVKPDYFCGEWFPR